MPRGLEVDIGISLFDLVPSLVRHLRAEDKAHKTIQAYTSAVELLDRFLAERGMPRTVTGVRREHVETFIAHLLERWKPATASNPTSYTDGNGSMPRQHDGVGESTGAGRYRDFRRAAHGAPTFPVQPLPGPLCPLHVT